MDSTRLLLGNGDGTFQPDVSEFYTSLVSALAATDFNRDGWLDLVATDSMLLHVTGDPEHSGK